MEALTLAEGVRFIEKFPVRRWTPIRVPLALWCLVAPLVSLGLLAWHASPGPGEPRRDAVLAASVDQRAGILEKIAARLPRGDQPAPTGIKSLTR